MRGRLTWIHHEVGGKKGGIVPVDSHMLGGFTSGEMENDRQRK